MFWRRLRLYSVPFRCGWGVAPRGFAVVKGKFVGGGLTFQHAGQGAAHFRGETLLLVGVSWDVCEIQGWATFVQADCCYCSHWGRLLRGGGCRCDWDGIF